MPKTAKNAKTQKVQKLKIDPWSSPPHHNPKKCKKEPTKSTVYCKKRRAEWKSTKKSTKMAKKSISLYRPSWNFKSGLSWGPQIRIQKLANGTFGGINFGFKGGVRECQCQRSSSSSCPITTTHFMQTYFHVCTCAIFYEATFRFMQHTYTLYAPYPQKNNMEGRWCTT